MLHVGGREVVPHLGRKDIVYMSWPPERCYYARPAVEALCLGAYTYLLSALQAFFVGILEVEIFFALPSEFVFVSAVGILRILRFTRGRYVAAATKSFVKTE